MTYLPAIEIEPQKMANASVIWLHGLGASGDDFASVAPMLKLNSKIHARFIFPHAPSRAITLNGGMSMPAWYDLTINGFEREINLDDLAESVNQVNNLIQREVERGINSERIVLAGFSQGGAVVYHTALNFDKPLAGLMALSTYIPNKSGVHKKECNKTLPILICHGTQDNVVPEVLGEQAFSHLTEIGFEPEFKTYPMAHTVHPRQIKEIDAWLTRILNQ